MLMENHKNPAGIMDNKTCPGEYGDSVQSTRGGEGDTPVVGTEAVVHTVTGVEIPYRIIVESMSEGILTITGDGQILYCNARFGEMAGISRERVIGATVLSFVKPDEQLIFLKMLEKGKSAGYRGEIRLKTGVGVFMPVTVSFHSHIIDNILEVFLVVSDITERKRSEESLVSMQKRLRELLSELSMAEEQERQRIAAYLHDRIGHTLALSQFRLEALREKLSSCDYDAEFERVHEGIVQAMNETRLLTTELYPPVLYEIGFAAAVEWLCEQISRMHNLRITVRTEESYRSLDPELRGMLFKAVNELLFNVVRHAEARTVAVTISREEDTFRVTVEDDGRGFDVSRINSPDGRTGKFGLFNIREHLNFIGGCLDIFSEIGKGTRITLITPVSIKYQTEETRDK